MKIPIAADHAGYNLKEYLKTNLKDFDFIDYGTNSTESMDYPDVIHPLASDINNGKYNNGIIICGSGNGVSMTANKYKNIRAAYCWNNDITEMYRLHNDANIIALPARYIDEDEALKMVLTFFNTEFEGGRHRKRINKI